MQPVAAGREPQLQRRALARTHLAGAGEVAPAARLDDEVVAVLAVVGEVEAHDAARDARAVGGEAVLARADADGGRRRVAARLGAPVAEHGGEHGTTSRSEPVRRATIAPGDRQARGGA